MVINNLMVTFMNAMGLSSSDYELTPGEGYGQYRDAQISRRADAAFWSSTAGRRSPLPHFYVGESFG